LRGGSKTFTALKAEGTVWSWGFNSGGSLGINAAGNRSSPVSVVGNHIAIAIGGGGGYHNMLIKSDNTLWMWGKNSSGKLGQSNTIDRSSPVSVIGNHAFQTVGGGYYHTTALKTNGEIWCWGGSAYGQVGDNSTTNRSSPVSIVGAHSFIQRTALAYSSGGLKSDGTVWMWGRNIGGELAQNDVAHRSSPVSVIGAHSFIKISSGGYSIHMLAIKSDGSMWSWGYNNNGGLGDNTTNNRSSPVSVIGSHSFVDMATGERVSWALKADGSIWAWGRGLIGELAQGNVTVNRSSPVSVVGSITWKQVQGSIFTGAALLNDLVGPAGLPGVLGVGFDAWLWGYNTFGQVGDNTAVAGGRTSPISVVGGISFRQISGGLLHSLGLNVNGTAWAWGNNSYGAIGDNTTTNRSSPVSVVGGHNFTQVAGGNPTGGGANSFGLKSDGTMWAWGNDAGGGLGQNDVVHRSSPVSVVGAHNFIQIAESTGLKSDGSAWCWGRNSYGQIGDGSATQRSSPTSVVGTHSFIQISAGNRNLRGHRVALKSDGSAWAWGINSVAGQLGDNTANNRSSPVSVVGAHSFVKVACGTSAYPHSIGLKADGTAWCWGSTNNTGGLGDNNNVNRSSPVSVVGNHSFIDISGGYDTTFALKDDGTKWGWGLNADGELADGTAINRSSPVSVIGYHAFAKITNYAASSASEGGIKVVLEVQSNGIRFNIPWRLPGIGQ
jgi:alpha-tubulin suppressor-like RCC1 family protein